MTRWKKTLLIILVAAGGILVLNTPARLDYSPTIDANSNLASLWNEPESLLIPGAEKRLTWHSEEQIRTEWSVVALHGFSATRQETAPLAEQVATRLGANLFETRFAAHGLKENGLVDVTAEEWLDDVAEALTIGKMTGDKVVVVGVSTGATLAMAMLDHPTMESVDAIILLSPNFAPADPKGLLITYPGGPLLLRLISGATRSWEAFNEQQEIYWTTTYPTRTLVQVMRVVDRANRKIATFTAPRSQFIYSPNDQVISVPALRSAYAALQTPEKEVIKVLTTGAPSAHIVAGDIISPHNTAALAEQIADFILRRAP